MQNVTKNEGFSQVCVWPGTIIGVENIETFTAFAADTWGIRIQYLEEIETYPNSNGPGNRNDAFFAIHNDDVEMFAIPRLQYGLRWIEDAVSIVNGGNTLYPPRVLDYCEWNADPEYTEYDTGGWGHDEAYYADEF